MLKNALLYEDQIRNKFYNIWYDNKYEYYFSSDYRMDFKIPKNGSERRDFVSIDSENNVLGYICYRIKADVRLVYEFGAINFSSNKITFGFDLKQVIDDIFMKFNMETLEFSVVCGNPIEKSYDRFIEQIGGKVLCIRHNRVKDLAGNIHDDKLYEINYVNYINFKLNKYSKKGD